MLPVFICASTLFLVTACIQNNHCPALPKIPAHIPERYFKATDGAFTHSQDTVFYGRHLFSGYVYLLYNNHDTAFVIGYYHGLQEGISRKWYPNKQLSERRLYINGKKEGIHQGWWPNGRLQFWFEVANDENSGVFKTWYSSGRREREFHYKRGVENGSEKIWWPDGTIRANYVLINGQKFGLSGQKLCINNTSSVIIK